MHVVLGLVLTIIIKLVILKLLARAGIGLGGLNPFMWHSKDRPDVNTVYRIDNPLDATALLVTAAASLERSTGSEHRAKILCIFIDEIGLSKVEAERLLDASVRLLNAIGDVEKELDLVIEPSLRGFTQAQAESAVRMIEQAVALNSELSQSRRTLVDNASARITSI